MTNLELWPRGFFSFRYLFFIWLLLGISNGIDAAEMNGLRCEYQDDPCGIDNPHPRLSWIIISKQRGEIQTAYQILVASDKELLAANHGDLWDSGQVPSDRSVAVEYAGQPLSSRNSCFWKVRVWDRNDKLSQWSSPETWTMGLLNSSDWTAQWISDPVLADPANRPLAPIHCYRSELASRPDSIKWFVFDLNAFHQVDAVDIIPARPKGENGDFRTAMYPLRFKVEVANSRDFHDAHLVVDQTGADYPNPRVNSCLFSFAAVSGRYVRFTATRLSYWDGHEYGLALGGFSVFDGHKSISLGTNIDCSDSLESENCSKRFLASGEVSTILAPDAPSLAPGMADVPAKSTVSRVPMMRREFNLPNKVRRATLYVSARGFYEAHINGQKVGDELLAPGYTDYGVRLQYQTFDVTSLVHRGPNAIGALLGYGWYAGHMNLFNLRCIYGYFPQFLAQLEVELADGTHFRINTDGQWHSTLDGPVRWSDILDGEGYDCRRELHGWDQPGFDEHAWSPSWSQPRNDVPLVSQFSQPVRKILELRPQHVKEVKPGVYVFDFGQEITGWCRLKANGADGAHVKIRHAEMIASDGNLDMKNLWGTRQEDDYVLDGQGSHVFEPHFTYHGFRYVELSGLPGKLKPDTLVAVNLRTDAPLSGQFECSNDLYNRIQKAAFWTQANLLFDVPAGCAARSERLSWTGDIRPCVQSLLFNFDAAAFLTKYTRDLRDDQSVDGRFSDICPHAHLRGTTHCLGSPGWADAGVSLPWDLYVNTGDQQMLAEYFDAARRWVDFVSDSNPDFIWKKNRGNDWGDWLSAGPATPKEIGATAFFAHSADLVARMAQALGRDSDTAKYHTLFEEIRQAFMRNYIDTNGVFYGQGNTQGSYALALQFGLLDEPLKSKAVEQLDRLVVGNKYHPTTGFWSSIELLLALSTNGKNQDAACMFDQRPSPSWGYMADHSTTMWEAFSANTRNLSLNHWTHSAVNEWLWRDVAGLNPDERAPGYEKFMIYPRPTSQVSWCKASYNSIRGRIASDWRCHGDTFNLRVTIPANATANIVVPTVEPETVEESGELAAHAKGVISLIQQPGAVVCLVGSGTYQFTSKIK